MIDVIVRRVASQDIYLAKQLADQVLDVRARDLAYHRIVTGHARVDPVEASAWAVLITDTELRQYAERQIRWAVE